MKRCPKCASAFPDSDKFCELHGLPLTPEDSAASAPIDDHERQRSPQSLALTDARPHAENKILAIGAVTGLVVAVLVFLIYRGFTQQGPTAARSDASSNTASNQPVRPLSAVPSPVVEVSPSPEESPSPSPLAAPSQSASPVRAALSSSAISTGAADKTARSGVTIRLTDGTSIEADEAWETGEGIWYRRRGIVTLLPRDQVKTIERIAPPQATPQATPAQSPSP